MPSSMNPPVGGLLAKVRAVFSVFDSVFLASFLGIAFLSMLILYSAGSELEGRFADHVRNFVLAVVLMWTVAHVKPTVLSRIALP